MSHPTRLTAHDHVAMSLILSFSENNEPAECGVLIIGEEASPDSPLESGKVCFNISMNEDLFKEAIEVFTLSLESEDPCVWLGRDQALLSVQENGGEKGFEYQSY